MNWKDVGQAVPKGLEILGGALAATGVGAPIGAAVAGVGALVANILGVPVEPEAVHAALQALTPEQQAALLTLQENNKADLAKANIQLQIAQIQETTKQQQAAYTDTGSARDRDVQIVKVTGHNWRADVLAYSAMLGFLGVLAALLVPGAVPATSPEHDALMLLLGTLIAIVKDLFGFEFGASQSDKTGDQSAALKALAAKQGGTQ